MPKGFSLLELLVAVTVFALITAIFVPSLGRLSDRIAVAQAAREAATFIQKGRLESVIRSKNIRLSFGQDVFSAYLESGIPGQADSLLFARSGPLHMKVSFTASRSEIRFQPTGLGYGAANTKLVFRRGIAADSVWTSIMGRVRRG